MSTLESQQVVTFDQGLPGFEDQRAFVLVSSPDFVPFTLLQGADADAPSFVGIDPRVVEPAYQASLGPDDLACLQATPEQALLWLALVTSGPHGATVNLRAPIVINPASMRGMQVVSQDSPYQLDCPLPRS